jgi:hypothetical protein
MLRNKQANGQAQLTVDEDKRQKSSPPSLLCPLTARSKVGWDEWQLAVASLTAMTLSKVNR